MSTLEIVLIGIVIGFILLAAVFRPNQVGGEGGGRNFISLLFLFVVGFLGIIYFYDKIDTNKDLNTYQTQPDPQQAVPDFRGDEDFNNLFIDAPNNREQIDKEEALANQYGGYEDELPQQYNSLSDTNHTLDAKSTNSQPATRVQPTVREHYVQVGAYSTLEGLHRAAGIHQQTYKNTIHMVNLANSTSNKAVYKAMAGPFTLQEAEAFKKQAQLSVKILTTVDLIFLTASPP